MTDALLIASCTAIAAGSGWMGALTESLPGSRWAICTGLLGFGFGCLIAWATP